MLYLDIDNPLNDDFEEVAAMFEKFLNFFERFLINSLDFDTYERIVLDGNIKKNIQNK